MESGLTMLLHSVIIGLVLYLIMVYVLGQRQSVAENRTIVLSALILIYMVVFGHGLPTKINKDLF
jgi:uncharacterized membrane-anchored protein